MKRSRAKGRLPWAVMHDPEGHNLLLLEVRNRTRGKTKRAANGWVFNGHTRFGVIV